MHDDQLRPRRQRCRRSTCACRRASDLWHARASRRSARSSTCSTRRTRPRFNTRAFVPTTGVAESGLPAVRPRTRATSSSPSSGSARSGSGSRSESGVRSRSVAGRRAPRGALFLYRVSLPAPSCRLLQLPRGPTLSQCAGPLRAAASHVRARLLAAGAAIHRPSSFHVSQPPSCSSDYLLPRCSSLRGFLSRFIVVGASASTATKRVDRLLRFAALLIRDSQIQARFDEVGRAGKRLLEPARSRPHGLCCCTSSDAQAVGGVGRRGSASSARR